MTIVPIIQIIIGFIGLVFIAIPFSQNIRSINYKHIFAAIFHRFKRDGVWSSMTPFFLKEIDKN